MLKISYLDKFGGISRETHLPDFSFSKIPVISLFPRKPLPVTTIETLEEVKKYVQS